MSGNYLQSLAPSQLDRRYTHSLNDYDMIEKIADQKKFVEKGKRYLKVPTKKKILLPSKCLDTDGNNNCVAEETILPTEDVELEMNVSSELQLLTVEINPKVPIPLLTLEWIFSTQYLHSMLYQLGTIPNPWSQLLRSFSYEQSNDSSSSYRQRMKKRKVHTFVEEVEKVVHVLDLWIKSMLVDSQTENDFYTLSFFGIGFGPSVNNLKKIFLLSFPQSAGRHLYDPCSSLIQFTANQIKQYENRLQRQFIQKLIEHETAASDPSFLSSGKQSWRRGNLFLFIKFPSFLISTMPSELLDLFTIGKAPSFSNYLEEKNNVPLHSQKKWSRKVSILNVQLSSANYSIETIGIPPKNKVNEEWLVLRRGVKLIPPSSASDEFIQDI